MKEKYNKKNYMIIIKKIEVYIFIFAFYKEREKMDKKENGIYEKLKLFQVIGNRSIFSGNIFTVSTLKTL